MHLKSNLNRTRIMILTIAVAIVCGAAALQHRLAKEGTLKPVANLPQPKASLDMKAYGAVDGALTLRSEQASKPLKRETPQSLAAERSTNPNLIDRFKSMPVSSNGSPLWLPDYKQLEKQPAAFNQSPGSAVEETKTFGGIQDLTEPARATSTAGGNAPEREREGRAEDEVRGDRPDEAAKFRSLQLQDEHGVIPADGLQKAREQMNVMRAAEQQRARAAGKPNGIEVAAIAPGDWQWLGPGNIGGRIRSIVIDPANANNMWVGSVSGGIWYSPNAGNSWGPVSDFMASLAVSSMVIDPTNSSIMYAGTGEGLWPLVEQVNFIDAVRGNGIFKSTDGGVTWNLLLQTNSADPLVCPGGGGLACPWSYVNRLAISPDGSTILAATVAGIYRSTDGGANWTLRPSFGGQIFDIDFDPTNSQKAIVAQAGRIGYSTDGGQGWIAASYSTDGGATFNATITGRAEVAYAPSNPAIVYASVDDNTGDFYKSVDGGKNYIRVNTGTNYFASGGGPDQGGYDNALWVNPQDATFVIVGGIDLWRSTDSGTTFTQISNWQCGPGQPNACAGSSAHADQHMIIAHPAFSNAANKVVYFGNDGGLFRADDVSTVSLTSGWNNLNHSLGITQFFGAAANSDGKIIAGAQDNGNSLYTGNANAWTAIATMSGDGGFARPILRIPTIYMVSMSICRFVGAQTVACRVATFSPALPMRK